MPLTCVPLDSLRAPLDPLSVPLDKEGPTELFWTDGWPLYVFLPRLISWYTTNSRFRPLFLRTCGRDPHTGIELAYFAPDAESSSQLGRRELAG